MEILVIGIVFRNGHLTLARNAGFVFVGRYPDDARCLYWSSKEAELLFFSSFTSFLNLFVIMMYHTMRPFGHIDEGVPDSST